MATLARRLFKGLLFFVLFALSFRYLYTLLLFFPPWNQYYSYAIARFFGVHDIELFDALCGMVTSLILAGIEYVVIMRIWRHYRAKAHSTLHR
jgi:hypothetical protein